MKTLKQWIIDLFCQEIIYRISELEEKISKIDDYLEDIAKLARYTTEKDEQSQEVFKLLKDGADLATKTTEQLSDELIALRDLRFGIANSQAVGRMEIEAKRNNLVDIDHRISSIEHKLQK